MFHHFMSQLAFQIMKTTLCASIRGFVRRSVRNPSTKFGQDGKKYVSCYSNDNLQPSVQPFRKTERDRQKNRDKQTVRDKQTEIDKQTVKERERERQIQRNRDDL